MVGEGEHGLECTTRAFKVGPRLNKYFTLKVIPIIEIAKFLRSCLAWKKYCSVFTDLTQDVSNITGI